jgi:hypothetical protein
MTSAGGRASVVRSATITGARSIDRVAATDLADLFADYLGPFADRGMHFYLGGAVGVDTLALDWLASHSGATMTVAVPCRVADQPSSAREVIVKWQRRGRVTRVVELGALSLGTVAYHIRNRWMVDRSDFTLGFPQGNDPSSGTWYTLDYTAALGKPRLVVPI